MNLPPLGSRFSRSHSGLMRSHLAPCRPLRSLQLAHASAVRAMVTTAALPAAAAPVSSLAGLQPRRV